MLFLRSENDWLRNIVTAHPVPEEANRAVDNEVMTGPQWEVSEVGGFVPITDQQA